MSYPVRLISGTDRLQLVKDGPYYEIGQPIYGLSDDQRTNLQASGVRFEAIHEDTPPMPADDPAPLLPPDQAALNAEIAAATKKPAAPTTNPKKEA